MRKGDIINNLNNEVLLAASCFKALPEEKFFARPLPEKWSPAEHAQHLILSVKPLITAFSLPRFVLRWTFGKPNRPGRTFDQVVEKYKAKLAAGGKASKPFIPKRLAVSDNPKTVIQHFTNAYSRFAYRLSSWPEEQLDRYLLPHPLLGKLTLREMLYFTIYHVSHHHGLVKHMQTD
ncbi:MAG: DinB family protein [Flammeovirgaceae bacterium]|nr:MAG: DinB family protein [Flammeovirgaceae bacterium]